MSAWLWVIPLGICLAFVLGVMMGFLLGRHG